MPVETTSLYSSVLWLRNDWWHAMTNGLIEYLSYRRKTRRDINRTIWLHTPISNIHQTQIYFTATVFYSKRVIESKRFPVSYWVVTLSSCLAMTLTSMEAAEAANTRSLGEAKQRESTKLRTKMTTHCSFYQSSKYDLEFFLPVLNMVEEVVMLSLSAAAIHCVTEV